MTQSYGTKFNIFPGDAGNPLYVFYEGTRIPMCLAGVASYTGMNVEERDSCTGDNHFVNVPFFIDWINTNVKKHSRKKRSWYFELSVSSAKLQL